MKDGIPKSLTLNNAPTIGSHARGVLEVLYERYQGRVSVIGTVSNDDPWPDFADRNLRVLDVNSAKVILRTANLYPFNKWNYDLEILQNHKSGPFATCRGQMLKQVKVKYWRSEERRVGKECA